MTEPAGPTNQDGIFYQNTVAAAYLADLLNLQPTSPRESVVEVRVEAPAHVDDIVVRYADRRREWIQAKSNLRSSSDAWVGLWTAFARQVADPSFGSEDRLVIALGRRSKHSADLQALAERAATSTDGPEWRTRLGSGLRQTLAAVEAVLPTGALAFDLFRIIDVRVSTLEEMNADFQRLDLGTASPMPRALQSHLRDLAGDAARTRAIFRATSLRRKLAGDFGADLFEPQDWGLAAYRETVRRASRIQIPGRGVSVPVADLIVWPRARLRDVAPDRDFEDELPRWDARRLEGEVNLARFPDDGLRQCILVAGPGFGKSTMIAALSARLIPTPIVPIEVALATFAETDQNVVEFLETNVNRDFSVRVDWRRLADRGLICVLFDGLDEVPTAHREAIVKRVRLFSSRFPDVAWLLTVRDPAALSGPLEGQIVELEPFDNPEISELAEKFSAWSTQLDSWTFTNSLEAYPEAARLARIPLFLSIMLAAWNPNNPLPGRRSDVIETYLASLFDVTKRKAQLLPELSDRQLRLIAQAIAFHSLQREEIALSERQATRVIAAETDHPSDSVLAQLLSSGVLKRGADRKLQFPYPIVQEYLAAVHIVDVLPDEVAARISDVVKRPWAQVIQFALELLPDPSPHIRCMLAVPDDAFSTGLRLIGRCVANGAAVSHDLRSEIGARLATLWGTANYTLRERVGRLLVDAFSRPLHPDVRDRLGWRWLLGSGAAEIVVKQADPDLTLWVVDELLERGLEPFMNLRGLKPALEVVATEVAVKIAERARQHGTTDDEFHGLSEFFNAIRLTSDAPPELVSLVSDVDVPLFVRLAGRAAMSEAPDAAAVATAVIALADARWQERSSAMTLLARVENIPRTIGDILIDSTVDADAKSHLIEHFSSIARDTATRGRMAREILARPELEERHRDILLVYQLRAGARDAFVSMIDRVEHAPLDVVQAVMVSMNHFPEKALGDLILAKLQHRSDPPSAAVEFAGAAIVGLTKRISHDGWNYYGVDEAPRHPSWSAWSPMFDRWIATAGLSKVERLRMFHCLVDIRPELLPEIRDIVFSATEPDSTEWDEDDGGHCLRSAMDELRRHRVPIPLNLAERFVRARRANLPYAGVSAIAAEATDDALRSLIGLYKTVDRDVRATILEALEVVAARLGVTIMPEDLAQGRSCE